MERFGNHVAVGSEPLGNGVGNAPFVYIHDCDEGAAGLARHGCNEETYCAGADYQGSCAWSRKGAVEGVDGDGEWLEESSRVKGDVVWDSGPRVSGRLVSEARRNYLWRHMAG